MKQQIHTQMLGKKVRIMAMSQGDSSQDPNSPHARYNRRDGQVGEIINVYLKEGSPAYDILFADGEVEEAMFSFGFLLAEPTTRRK